MKENNYIINKKTKSMKNLLVLFLLIFVAGGYAEAQDWMYIGAAKCKMCHNKPATGAQYKQWLGTKHAKAMESLKGDEKEDPNCLKCHSTAAAADPDLVRTITIEEGVSCETCHGPGSGYKSNSVMKDRQKSIEKGLIIPDEKLCRTCHNEESPNFKGFNYEEYLKKIAHPIPNK